MIDPEKVVLTEHAKAQAIERGILRPTILAVIMNGEKAPGRYGAILFTAWGYTVVVQNNRVITAYENNTGEKGGRKRKRKRSYSGFKRTHKKQETGRGILRAVLKEYQS